MWRGIPEPRQAVIVEVRKNRADGAAVSYLAGWFRAPRARIEARKEKLVHCVVDRISLYQGIAMIRAGGRGSLSDHLYSLLEALL